MITRTLTVLLLSTLLASCSLFDPDANLKSEKVLLEEGQGHIRGGRFL